MGIWKAHAGGDEGRASWRESDETRRRNTKQSGLQLSKDGSGGSMRRHRGTHAHQDLHVAVPLAVPHDWPPRLPRRRRGVRPVARVDDKLYSHTEVGAGISTAPQDR